MTRCVPSKYYWKRPDMTSSGFCLVNTVAVAAAYARYRYGREGLDEEYEMNDCPTVSNSNSSSNGGNNNHDNNSKGKKKKAFRIAIVDIDVHHGNGTEEIVRNLRLDCYTDNMTPTYLYFHFTIYHAIKRNKVLHIRI